MKCMSLWRTFSFTPPDCPRYSKKPHRNTMLYLKYSLPLHDIKKLTIPLLSNKTERCEHFYIHLQGETSVFSEQTGSSKKL